MSVAAFRVQWMLPRAEWGAFESSAPIEHPDLRGDLVRRAGVRTAAEPRPVFPQTAGLAE